MSNARDLSKSKPLIQGTAQATTSGTSKDFTGIPSWATRITVMFQGFSTNGAATSAPQIQLGTASGIETTGYQSAASVTLTGSTTGATSSTTGLLIMTGPTTTPVVSGTVVLTKFDGGNNWISCSNMASQNAGATYAAAGSKSLAGVLTQLRITTVNGTDAFDAGSVNIMYE